MGFLFCTYKERASSHVGERTVEKDSLPPAARLYKCSVLSWHENSLIFAHYWPRSGYCNWGVGVLAREVPDAVAVGNSFPHLCFREEGMALTPAEDAGVLQRLPSSDADCSDSRRGSSRSGILEYHQDPLDISLRGLLGILGGSTGVAALTDQLLKH